MKFKYFKIQQNKLTFQGCRYTDIWLFHPHTHIFSPIPNKTIPNKTIPNKTIPNKTIPNKTILTTLLGATRLALHRLRRCKFLDFSLFILQIIPFCTHAHSGAHHPLLKKPKSRLSRGNTIRNATRAYASHTQYSISQQNISRIHSGA
jgi:hypothetical protein